MNKWLIGVICSLLLGSAPLQAQPVELAAIIRVIGQNIVFQRENTQTELSLRPTSVALLGVGDTIRTGENGRVLIHLADGYEILLLPNSEYTLINFERNDFGVVQADAALVGIAVHNFTDTKERLQYQLQAETFEVSATAADFAVWAVPNLGLQAVTNALGEVEIYPEGETQVSITAETGFAVSYSTQPVSLNLPLHASQLVAQSVKCDGVVNINTTEGLRLRAGAALDFLVVDALEDKQHVSITGTTENGLWYRIPFQTGFGWIYSSLIIADCEGLRRFPNLYGEAPERVRGVTPTELEMLTPFYGIPETNNVFYR